ncbi:MAG: hypothetical protein AAF438_16420 [Pseudomonadota bacterium]
MRNHLFLLIFSIFFANLGLAQADIDDLLLQGDQLAETGEYAEALLKYKDAYQILMPQLRSLAFKHPVTPNLMRREDLGKHLSGLIDEEYSDADMKMMDQSLKVFGMASSDMDLKETLLALYTEQVAGFYEPENDKMFLIADHEPAEKQSFLAELFAPKGFNADEQKVILAHEMAHALQDQHYDLHELYEQTKSNDDRALALSALVEGDATVVMFAEQQRLIGQPTDLSDLPPGVMDFSFNALKVFLPFSGGKAFASAPRILKDSLLFPYHKGAVFVIHLSNEGGWGRVDEAWHDLPESTEQILHPKKYLASERDRPISIEIPEFSDLADEDWQLLGSNVMGEFQIRSLLGGIPFAAAAAAGWGGDRYQTFFKGGKRGLIWSTRWDSERDAYQFGVAYQNYLQRRLELEPSPDAEATYGIAPFTGEFSHSKDAVSYSIKKLGKDVVIVEGFGEALTQHISDTILDLE